MSREVHVRFCESLEVQSLRATRPRLKGNYHGKWYYLYLSLDLFSRYIVGWMVTETESARNAQHFIRETVNKHLKKGDKVTLHSDQGAAMTVNRTQELHGLLGLLIFPARFFLGGWLIFCICLVWGYCMQRPCHAPIILLDKCLYMKLSKFS